MLATRAWSCYRVRQWVHQHNRLVKRSGQGVRLLVCPLPVKSPWLNPIEMLWRHFRREVTHCELFETVKALLAAARDFFDRYNQMPHKVLSIIGSPFKDVLAGLTPKNFCNCT